MQNRNWLYNRAVLLELFVIINLSFLALDVFIAHSVNSFAHRAEWIPLIFSLAAPLLLLLTLFRGQDRMKRCVGRGVGWVSVFIGIGGMLFHLESQFFSDLTVKSLVYTAPFIAPLSYAGIGLLLIMHHTVEADSAEWGRWILVMAFVGFLGNFLLSLCDHAQNGFFNWGEWIPVYTSAMAVGFLVTAIVQPHNVSFLKLCLAILALNCVTGIVGFCWHVSANLQVSAPSVKDSFLYGAPAFAPLLFPNLSLLGALGIFGVMRGR
ncbi:MAG: hypothetical protein OXN17_07165 [Candidatus Poribacteria bacterium]|nr:hypothetical protein [Candidatus Poribacteria bacterium]MDE0504138.1 hypothetical protein [Candidatus Poribacteria bacterium]